MSESRSNPRHNLQLHRGTGFDGPLEQTMRIASEGLSDVLVVHSEILRDYLVVRGRTVYSFVSLLYSSKTSLRLKIRYSVSGGELETRTVLW